MHLPANRLSLFGAIELIHHGQPIDLARARLDELVAYLAIRPGEPYLRSQIAYALWTDSSEKQARTNLRNLIFNLKKNWPSLDSAISIQRAALCWRSDADVTVDITLFEQLLTQAQTTAAAQEQTAILAEAASLYRGDLLPNCYEDWAMAARQRLREQYGQAVEQLIDGLFDLRRYSEALDWAKQLLAHDPLQESVHRRLMQCYMALGDRSAALRTYHDCADMLQAELGVEPSAATLQVYEHLLGQNTQVAKPVEQPVEQPPPSTPRPRLVGRLYEWQAQLAAWRRAGAGQSGMVLIQGEAGIGKTRLAEELIDWVGRQGHAWAGSRSYAARGAIAYAPVAAWLRSPHLSVALAGVDDLWRVEVFRLLPELAAERPDLPPPGPIAEDWQRHRFFQAVAQTIRSCPAPLLLHLDDMQWTDPETLAFLHFLLQSLHDHPLLVVGCAREEEMAANEALVRLLHDLSHSEHLTELSLGPLSAADIRDLAEQTAGAQIDSETASSLYADSEGHPLLLVETIRADAQRQDHEETPKGRADRATLSAGDHRSIPAKIFSLMDYRLNQISSSSRELAELAAVIGRDFSFDLLCEAGECDEGAVIEALDELWRRRIVRHQRGAEYDFSHDRLREVAYQQISPPRRQFLHRRAARAMETLYQTDLDAYVGQIAAHYENGDEQTLACTNYARAATVATRQHALSSADAFYEAALRLAPQSAGSQRLQLLQEQAQIYPSLGKDVDRWRQNLEAQDAIARTGVVKDPAKLVQVHLCHANYHLYSDAYLDSIRAADAAIGLANETNDVAGLAQAYLMAGEADWFQSRMIDARRHYAQAVHFARLAGYRAIEAKALENAAAVGMFSGVSPDQLHDYLHQALALAEETDSRLIEASIHNKYGFQANVQGMGEWDAAEKHFQHGLAIAQETDNRVLERLILANLGVLYINMGDYRRAIHHLDAADAAGTGDQQMLRARYAQNYLARAYLYHGRLDDAYRILMHAVAQLRASRHLHGEVRARSDLGYLLHLQSNHEEARRVLRSILKLARQYGDTRQEALASVRLGYVEEAGCRWEEAARAYKDGYECHTAVGQRYHAMNGLAGLAGVAAHRGDRALAHDQAGQVWEALQGQQVDATLETTRTYRICHEIFVDHADLRATDVFETAWRQLTASAGTIDEQDHVALFWQLPDHRYFLSLLERPTTNG